MPTDRTDEALASIAGTPLAEGVASPRSKASPSANTAITAMLWRRVFAGSSWLKRCRFHTVITAPPGGSRKAMIATLMGDQGSLPPGPFSGPLSGATGEFVAYLPHIPSIVLHARYLM